MALWCQPTPLACQPASPAGVQSPRPLAHSLHCPTYARRWACCPPNTILLYLFLLLRCTGPCVWVAFVTALSPGSRLAYGRLACHRAFAVEFSSCGAQSPEEVSGVPNSQPAAAHIRCTRCTTELLLEMRCVCDEILETGEQFLVSHLLGNLDRNVEGASLLLVEHPPVWPRCPMHFISVQLCPIDTETRSARALHSEESNRHSGTANNRPASCQTIPTQSKQAKHNPDNRSSPGTNLSLVW